MQKGKVAFVTLPFLIYVDELSAECSKLDEWVEAADEQVESDCERS